MLQNLTVKLSNLPCLEKILLLSTFCFINSRLVYFFKLNSLTSAMKKSHKSSNEIKLFILHTNQEIEIMREIFYNDMLGFYLNRSMRNRNWLCSFQKEQKVFMQIYWGCQGAHPVKSHEITKKPWLENGFWKTRNPGLSADCPRTVRGLILINTEMCFTTL